MILHNIILSDQSYSIVVVSQHLIFVYPPSYIVCPLHNTRGGLGHSSQWLASRTCSYKFGKERTALSDETRLYAQALSCLIAKKVYSR
jgi:hypothetical protein